MADQLAIVRRNTARGRAGAGRAGDAAGLPARSGGPLRPARGFLVIHHADGTPERWTYDELWDRSMAVARYR